MCVLVALAFGANSQSLVQWMDYSTALEKAKTEPKLIFVDMYADWCIPCRVIKKNVYMRNFIRSSWT